MTPSAPRLGRAAPALLAVLTVAFAAHRVEDFDVWYHLAAGRAMWTTWHWPATNTFAFTAPDYPWIDLHWVFQLLLYAAHGIAGPTGCTLLAIVLLLTTVGILYGFAIRFLPPAAAALLLAVALTIASPRFVPRPELLSFVLFALYLRLLEGQPANGRAIYLLVPLQILWANTEGIFAVGLALIGCYWAGATAAYLPVPRGWKAASGLPAVAWRRLTLALTLAVAGCALNPYGIAGALFPLQLLPRVTGGSLFSTRIGEFRAPFESGFAPAITWTWVALMVATSLAVLANVRQWRLGRLLAVIAFAWLSTQALRNMAFFAWIAVVAIAADLGSALAARNRRLPAGTPAPFLAEIEDHPGRGRVHETPGAAGALVIGARCAEIAALGAIVLLTASLVTNQLSRFLGIEREFGLGVSRVRFPSAAVRFADEAGITGRPFNCLPMGGYLAWARPGEKVFVDGRLEAFPDVVFRNYFRVMDEPKLWPQLVGRYHVDYAVVYHAWRNRLPLVVYLAEGHGWELVYYDEIAAIFLPADDAHRELRERAERAFAERRMRQARETAPAPASTLARALSVPVAEIWRQGSYGNFLRAIGQYGDAAAAYRRVLALDPDSTDARFFLGLSLWYSGEREAAIREWRDVLRRDPRDQRASRALADATGRDSRAP